jgi:hypothetical protein
MPRIEHHSAGMARQGLEFKDTCSLEVGVLSDFHHT